MLAVDDGSPLVVIPSSVLWIVALRRFRALIILLWPSQSFDSILFRVRWVLDAIRADFKRVQLSKRYVNDNLATFFEKEALTGGCDIF